MVFFDPWVHKKIAEAFGLPWEREPPRPYEEWIEEEKRKMREQFGITPGGPSLMELVQQVKADVVALQQEYERGIALRQQITQEALQALERAQLGYAGIRGQIQAVLAGLQAPALAPVTPPLFEIPEIRIPDWLKWTGIGILALLILGLIAKVMK